ncbi:MAG TPA: IS21 family transposase [Gemmataceae bacterium]|nr:IS21 family transposase [Gemmataceae bacterium]
MLTVDDYGTIRRAYRDGMSIRELARTFHHSRYKIRAILQEAQPRPYTRSQPPPAPILGPYHALIDAILADDEQAPPKQRHTAMQVFRRLCDEQGYRGGYNAVRRYIGKQRRQHRETFIPLAHDPGQRLEADFGHIHVDFPSGRRLVPVLIAAWAYSHYGFAWAAPSERTEAILAGLVEAFAFFGCVPHEVWWDNPTTVVAQIFTGRDRRPNPYYAALASHYTFEPLFCMPAKGNEKPHAETRVRVLQQQWATPVPQVADWGALNRYLRQRCLRERERTVAGYQETMGQRFERDRAGAVGLPAHPFDACIVQAAQVDKYQTVRFDNNRYSVPRACAYQGVTVKGYVERVEVVVGGQVVARHPRSYQRDEQILDPLHYLAALGRRPAALDHAPVLRDWQLPACFTQLRQALEQRHGLRAGARQYIRVLQLLAEHPLERVQQAVTHCLPRQPLDADRIRARVARLAEAGSATATPTPEVPPACPSSVTPLCQYQVPRPDLGRFDQLLSQGEEDDGCERQHASAAAEQSQTTAAANHA